MPVGRFPLRVPGVEQVLQHVAKVRQLRKADWGRTAGSLTSRDGSGTVARTVMKRGCRHSDMEQRERTGSWVAGMSFADTSFADTYFAEDNSPADTPFAHSHSADKHSGRILETSKGASGRRRRRSGRGIVAGHDKCHTAAVRHAGTAKRCVGPLRPGPDQDLRSMILGYLSCRGRQCGHHPCPK